MSFMNNLLAELSGISPEFMFVIISFCFFYFKILKNQNSLISNIIIVSFALAFFDFFLKKIILISVDNDYYKFIINNVITIVMINILITFFKADYKNFNLTVFFNLTIACLFYETIVFKLYNYNNLCNTRLRSMTKTIMRLATIHILTNLLNNKPYDTEWFNNSIAQITNFAIFDIVFSE